MSLVVMRVYVFSCDHPGCEEYSEEVLPRADEPRKLAYTKRYLTESYGWAFKGASSFCPQHVAGPGGAA